jgi:hypothetical protein
MREEIKEKNLEQALGCALWAVPSQWERARVRAYQQRFYPGTPGNYKLLNYKK